MNFREMLQSILDFLDEVEGRFDALGPTGSDIDTVKRQMNQLRDFQSGVDSHVVKIEQLNRQAAELMENTSPNQVSARHTVSRICITDLLRFCSQLSCGMEFPTIKKVSFGMN